MIIVNNFRCHWRVARRTPDNAELVVAVNTLLSDKPPDAKEIGARMKYPHEINAAIVAGFAGAGPRVATIVHRRRLISASSRKIIGTGRALRRIGQLNGPVLGFLTRIDFEKAGSLETTH